MTRAALQMSSIVMFPLWRMFFTFFAVPVWLLKSLDDERCSRGTHCNRSLSVLDCELDGDLQPFPVAGCLGNVLANFLWGKAKWSDLWSKRAGGSHLSADNA